MNDPQQGWINALLTTVIGLLAFMLNLYRRKVDRIEDKHASFVSRDELQRHMDLIRDDRLRMHEENQDRLREIGSDIRAVHVRIDQVFSNGKNGNGGK
jgi:hypothetical protein